MKRKLRFSVRTLLILVLIATVPCWWVASEVSEFTTEEQALRRMQEVNSRMSAVWENQTPDWMKTIGIQPKWMNRIVRLDATGVTCGKLKFEEYPKSQIEFRDEDLAEIADDIKQLDDLREIYFQVTHLSDKSIDYFSTLKGLEILNLQATDVTPAGAEKLQSTLASTSVEHHQAK